jgi:hypothetical protein
MCVCVEGVEGGGLPLASSVTINAKTTVHCSLGSSIVLTVQNLFVEPVVRRKNLRIACVSGYQNCTFVYSFGSLCTVFCKCTQLYIHAVLFVLLMNSAMTIDAGALSINAMCFETMQGHGGGGGGKE